MRLKHEDQSSKAKVDAVARRAATRAIEQIKKPKLVNFSRRRQNHGR